MNRSTNTGSAVSSASSAAQPVHWVVYGNNPAARYCQLYLVQQLPRERICVSLVAPGGKVSGAGFLFGDSAMEHCEIGIDPRDLLQSNTADILLALRIQSEANPQAGHWLASGGYGFMHQGQPFFHWWQRSRTLFDASEFNLVCRAAEAGRYGDIPTNAPEVYRSLERGLQFSYRDYCDHLDLAAQSRKLPVYRQQATLSPVDEHRFDLQLADGTRMQAGFIIDCDGALLAESALHNGQGGRSLPLPASRMTQTLSGCRKRLTAAHCTIGRDGWQLNLRGLRLDHKVIPAEYLRSYPHAWAGNLIGLGAALNIGGLAVDSLAQTQYQLRQLLPLMPLQTEDGCLRAAFNRQVATYNREVTDLHSLCHWLAGHTRRLSPGARAQLALFRASGSTLQTDIPLISAETRLLLPTLAGFWPRPGTIPTTGGDSDYNRWVRKLSADYRQAATTLPEYHCYLQSLCTSSSREKLCE
ncbi:tryptophan 7-halogenase [uncultured Microbulbifer sp.]|uniref:tryptophan 7-halogenase n=1 Tax=uncultured Microbulbifer sp. TaxID=348147 RepID=UPI002607B5FD|nr:tryptophan 7-halogenase [uncultured Microbulbifer sp.]